MRFLIDKNIIFGFVLYYLTCDLCLSESHWSYKNPSTGPDKWPELYKTMCSGTWQSPINLRSDIAVKLLSQKTIRIFYSKRAPNSTAYTVTNNGHSIQVGFPADHWFVSFGNDESEDYSVVQLHFHWGKNSSVGSEHEINSKRFPMESHLVCYRKYMYPDFQTAAGSPGGLAVLGFLHTLSRTTTQKNTQLGLLGTTLDKLKQPLSLGVPQNIGYVNVAKLLSQVNPSSFFRYAGSLTTPPCTENVMWTVFDNPIPVEEEQLKLLRQQIFPPSEGQAEMYDNFRPIQPLDVPNSILPRELYKSSASRFTFALLGPLCIFAVIIGANGL